MTGARKLRFLLIQAATSWLRPSAVETACLRSLGRVNPGKRRRVFGLAGSQVIRDSNVIQKPAVGEAGLRKTPVEIPGAQFAARPCKSSILKALQHAERFSARDCTRLCSFQILEIQQGSTRRDLEQEPPARREGSLQARVRARSSRRNL